MDKLIIPVPADIHPEQHNPIGKYGWTTHEIKKEDFPALYEILSVNVGAKEELKKFMFNFQARK